MPFTLFVFYIATPYNFRKKKVTKEQKNNEHSSHLSNEKVNRQNE